MAQSERRTEDSLAVDRLLMRNDSPGGHSRVNSRPVRSRRRHACSHRLWGHQSRAGAVPAGGVPGPGGPPRGDSGHPRQGRSHAVQGEGPKAPGSHARPACLPRPFPAPAGARRGPARSSLSLPGHLHCGRRLRPLWHDLMWATVYLVFYTCTSQEQRFYVEYGSNPSSSCPGRSESACSSAGSPGPWLPRPPAPRGPRSCPGAGRAGGWSGTEAAGQCPEDTGAVHLQS